MLGGGGIKAAAKRTAFGDVSNVINGPRPSKDDSNLPSRPSSPGASKAIHAFQEKKSAALLRPAQRPLSVSSLKGLLTGSSCNNNVDTTAKTANGEPATSLQSANTRKVLTKRNTTIFKDSALRTVEEVIPSIPQQSDTAVQSKEAPLKPVPVLEPSTTQNLDTKDPSQCSEHLPSDNSHTNLTEAIHAITTLSSEAEDADGVRSDGIYIDEKGNVRVYQEPIPSTRESQHPLDTRSVPTVVPTINNREAHQPRPSKTSAPVQVHPPVLPNHIQPLPPSDPEEYWDDDEEDNDDEEGYVTARSYRSKGDNTTGGATTILFPQINPRVKREIAAAKLLVEATRTADEIEDEVYDTTMVAEYGDEIFDYMKGLEVGPHHPSRTQS